MDKIVYAAVKALIQHEGRFLLLKQNVDGEMFYDLPGGRVEFAEDPYQALVREAKEEVGLQITIEKPIGLWWFFRKRDGHQVVCSTFLCSVSAGSVDLGRNPTDEKIEGQRWVTADEILTGALAIQPESLQVLLSAAVGDGKPL